MFYRNITKKLEKWKETPHPKPLIIRGARQTGKTTLIETWGMSFESFISLNLEKKDHAALWKNSPEARELIRAIELFANQKITPGKTLLFLDEIQNEPVVITSLRYLHEAYPNLHIIATGSLLEVSLEEKGFSFPVGRVSFVYLHPLTFDEYLKATDKNLLAEELNGYGFKNRISSGVHLQALKAYEEYILVGGMPEVVQAFKTGNSFYSLKQVKQDLMTSFEEDVPKYAKKSRVADIQLLIHQAPFFAGQKVTYTNFANSGIKAREMKEAFDTLEKAMIIQRIKPTPCLEPPLLPKDKVASGLLYLDTGLVCQKLGVESPELSLDPWHALFRGAISAQAVGQEIVGWGRGERLEPFYWYRNQPHSNAEVDYLVQIGTLLIPIEVKAGKSGTLKSLVQFMESASHPYAVRVYAGELSVETITSPGGKKFFLLNVPFYLVFRLNRIIKEWIGK